MSNKLAILIVLLVLKNLLLTPPAVHAMAPSAWIFYAEWSGHVERLVERSRYRGGKNKFIITADHAVRV